MVRLCAERRCEDEEKKGTDSAVVRKSSPLVGAGGASRIRLSGALIAD